MILFLRTYIYVTYLMYARIYQVHCLFTVSSIMIRLRVFTFQCQIGNLFVASRNDHQLQGSRTQSRNMKPYDKNLLYVY